MYLVWHSFVIVGVETNMSIMKKILFAVAIATTFAACKGKKDATLDSNKDLILLTDSSRMKAGSYLTDTGVAATAATRNADNTAAETPKRNTNTGKASTSSNNNNSGGGTSTNTGSTNNNSTATTTAPQKKGVSKAAKGAIIGGVGGAIIGGVAGKNAKGAIIGGAVGAAGGYIIGRGKDKKDGRVQ